MMKLIASSVLAIATGVAQANITQYTSRDIFERSLSNKITDDYEAAGYNPSAMTILSDAAMSSVLGETQYKATWFLDTNTISTAFNVPSNHFYCSGCNGTFDLFFNNTSIGDLTGVFGVGFDIYASADMRAVVTFGDGSSEQIALPIQLYTKGIDHTFIGLTSDQRISSISFLAGPSQAGGFVIDNLTIGSAVPEPSMLALSVIGLAAIFLRTRGKHSPKSLFFSFLHQ